MLFFQGDFVCSCARFSKRDSSVVYCQMHLAKIENFQDSYITNCAKSKLRISVLTLVRKDAHIAF